MGADMLAALVQCGKMDESELAERLRERIRKRAPELAPKAGLASGDDLIVSTNRTGDRAMIESYITCADCGAMECTYERAIELARYSMTVDEWFDCLDDLRSGIHPVVDHQDG
jgi:hypothetical protein